MIFTYKCPEFNSTFTTCNVRMISFKNRLIYRLDGIMQPRIILYWFYSLDIIGVFNHFLPIYTHYATDRGNISSDQNRFYFWISLFPLLFYANTPFDIFYLSCISLSKPRPARSLLALGSAWSAPIARSSS